MVIYLKCLLMIMTSYYYSVGGLLVFVIYGIYCYLKLNKKITIKSFDRWFKFLIPIFIGILLSGILLLPIMGVILSSRVDIETSITLKELFIPQLDLNILLYDAYSLGLTSIAFIALINNFLIKEKDKFLNIIISIIFFIPIFMYLLNGTLYIRAKVLIPFYHLWVY